MTKIKYVVITTFFIIMLSACAPSTQTFILELNSDTLLSDIILTDQNGQSLGYEMDQMTLTNIELDGVTEIHISLEGYTFNPNVITLADITSDTFTVDVTKIEDEPDPEPEPEQTTRTEIVHVYDATELESALNASDTKTVLFRADIEMDIQLDAPIDFNLNGHTLTGHLTVAMDDTFKLTIHEGTITGDLIITAPNLTLETYAQVDGDIIIHEIYNQSFIGHAPIYALYIYAPDSRIILNNNVAYLELSSDDIYLELNAVVDELLIPETSTNIEIVHASFIKSAEIDSEHVLLDGLPEILTGISLPMFTHPVLLDITYDIDQTFEHGLTVHEIMDLLPDTVEITTTTDTFFVDVLVYTIHQGDYDTQNPDAQTLEAIGLLDLPEDLINVHQLELIFNVTVLSFRDSNTEITHFETIDPIEIPFGEVATLEAIINFLPETILAYAIDDASFTVDTSWTLATGTFDPDNTDEQVLSFETEMLNIPDGYHNLDMITPYVHVTILAHEQGLVEPFGNFHVQANIPEGVDIHIDAQNIEGGTYYTVTLEVNPDYTYKHMELYDSGYIFTTDLTYTQYVSPSSQFYFVVILEKIYRPDITTAFNSGDGSEENPLMITTADHFNNIRYFLDKGFYFMLGNDIHLSAGSHFEPMNSPSQSVPFNGVIDGQNFSVYNYSVHQTNANVSNAFIDENAGVIQNIKFIDVDVSRDTHYRYDGTLVRRNLPGSRITNVEITGSRSNGGAGLVGVNFGLIENILIDMNLINANAGLAVRNHHIIRNSQVTVTMLINQKHLGYIAGVVASNEATEDNPAVIQNIDATVYIDYEIEKSSFDNATELSGFVYMNRGYLDTIQQAMILDSTLYVEINALNDNYLDLIGGFVGTNSNLGLINFGEVSGYIHGGVQIGGFVALNIAGIQPGVITNSTADVDVYGQGNRVGGFVGVNNGSTVPTAYKARIEYSESFGDVYGSGSLVGSFVGQQDGILLETTGHGTVFDISD